MDGFFDLFSILLACYGVYFLYLFVQTKFRGKPVNVSNFLPSDLTMKRCRQPEAFTAFILPRFLIFGVLLMCYSALSFLQLIPSGWFYFAYAVPVILFYIITVRQSRKYW